MVWPLNWLSYLLVYDKSSSFFELSKSWVSNFSYTYVSSVWTWGINDLNIAESVLSLETFPFASFA